MYAQVPTIQLCGSFICIGQEYIIDLSKTLKIMKVDYTTDQGEYYGQCCVAFYLSDSVNEAILFESEYGRDIFFERLKVYISTNKFIKE